MRVGLPTNYGSDWPARKSIFRFIQERLHMIEQDEEPRALAQQGKAKALSMAMTGLTSRTGRHDAQTFHNRKLMHALEKRGFKCCVLHRVCML